jgi:hypothetical protein
VAGNADVVAVREYGLANADRRVAGCDHLSGEVDPWNQRADPSDLAVEPRGEPVLVIDARPVDPEVDLAGRKVGRRKFARAGLDALLQTRGDERWKCRRDVDRPSSLLLRRSEYGERRGDRPKVAGKLAPNKQREEVSVGR